ncbi:hypothetical protein HOY80DRAFT_959176 [Tuber brumale]|nr:hypothetical protein HOY80DRAFT_959176 [Tuber brumale]
MSNLASLSAGLLLLLSLKFLLSFPPSPPGIPATLCRESRHSFLALKLRRPPPPRRVSPSQAVLHTSTPLSPPPQFTSALNLLPISIRYPPASAPFTLSTTPSYP